VISRSFSPRHQSPRARRGYSLLELLIVMMVMGVMTRLSMGKVHALMSQQRVVYAATAIQNDLEAAFQIAARNRKPVQIQWTAATQQFAVTDRSGTMYYRKTNLGKQAYGFSDTAVTVSQSPLQVFPNGLAASDLLITLKLNGVMKKLHMTRTGLVQIQ
jgi:prepilin-type N-terminal cleavage/methylation domain-containing protein